jgi:Zn-dependent M28 family amino/carboxypeptidase
MLPGTTHPDETILFSGHWDHLGIGTPDAKGDKIYNGAVDNATGIASIIEQARAFAAEPRTQRTLVFMAVTAEEKGLLGSTYYGANPLFPLGKTVAAFNTDALGWMGPTKDFSISGTAQLDLLDLVKAEAAKVGRHFTPDAHPEGGGFFRSDHFPFAKVGVPAISFESGMDLVNGGIARGEELGKMYGDERYHQPADEYDAAMADLSGLANDVSLLHTVGRILANSRDWPNWSADSEFRATRDATKGDRQ